MKFEPFDLERIQSIWEHEVEINLTESGVSPITLGELLDDPRSRPFLFDQILGYSQTNGSIPLRERIASMYPGTTADNVLVTNGGAEANFIAAWNLFLESGGAGELIVMLPNYMQLSGIWKNLGGRVKSFYLRMIDGKWIPDLEQLKSMVTRETTAIAICTPNNPTGAIVDESAMKTIANIAEDANSWLISDEIYRGAEFEDSVAPSAFGRSDKVLVTSSLSKVYGLPGLRIGWIVSTDATKIQGLWAYGDYTTICPSVLSDYLATIALDPENRVHLQERARGRVRANWHVMEEWLEAHSDIFTYIPPQAASMCFPKYDLEINSISLVERLRLEKNVLIVPGSHFGMDKFLRIGFGYGEEKLREGLKRLSDLVHTIK
ncbi:MAG: aminotransferase class I/II-fold pyridoxal phosphate-dependent enzyme [Candidatus Thorarchaeota archaeon]